MQQVDDPPSLPVGTEVSAKYKGAFCEAKVSKVVRNIKVKVAYKQGLGSGIVSDELIKAAPGQLRVGATVEVRHPDRKEPVEATVTKIQDGSQYTVVFDDGDITTLRRTALCLKSGRHFNESETLDQLPLTHPEHFGNPVVGGRRGRRRGHLNEDSSEEEEESESKEVVNEKEENIGKVVCVEIETKKKDKEKFFPGLVVAPTAQATVRIRVKDDYLVRSFKDGRYYTVPKKEATEFTREAAIKQNSAAVQAALEFLDNNVLPAHWDRDTLFGLRNSSSDDEGEIDSDSSDDEPREEKDRFVAQLYKYMDDRGTPLNKVPTIQNRDVDLYRLFRAVQKRGGYNRVTAQNQWKSVATRLGFTPVTTSVSNMVKQSFKKFLQPYGDFNRKLGCSMLMTPRNSSRTKGRSLVRAISVASPKPTAEPNKESVVTTSKTTETVIVSTAAKTPLPSTPTTAAIISTPTTVSSSSTSAISIPIQSVNDESENTSESSQDLVKNRRKPASSSTSSSSGIKVKTLVEKYEEKTASAAIATALLQSNTKDESDLPLSKIKAAAASNALKFLEEKEARERENNSSTKDASISSKDSGRSGSTPATRDPSPAGSVASTTTSTRKDKSQKKPIIAPAEERRNKRKKDEISVEKVDAGDFIVEVGDKLKVYYHEKKVTYEAKVIEITLQRGIPMYMVHYTGWNNRYDEWVPRERIAENLSKSYKNKKGQHFDRHGEKSKENPPKPPSSADLQNSISGTALNSTSIMAAVNKAAITTASKRGRGRSESARTRSVTPSSVASNSGRTKSVSTTISKHRRSVRTGSRRVSVTASDISMPTESETDSDEPVKPRSTRASKDTIYKPHPASTKKRNTSANNKGISSSAVNSQSETGDDADDDDEDGPPHSLCSITSSVTSSTGSTQKGRDYDLNQIRSELKGFKGLKSPSPANLGEQVDTTSTDLAALPTDVIKEEKIDFDYKSTPISTTPSTSQVSKALATATTLEPSSGAVTTTTTTTTAAATTTIATTVVSGTSLDDSSSKQELKKEKIEVESLAKSTTDISSETDSYADDDSQSSDRTTQLQNMTKKFQQKINADKQRVMVKNLIGGTNKNEQNAINPKTRIVEKILKESMAEKRQESLKNKPNVMSLPKDENRGVINKKENNDNKQNLKNLDVEQAIDDIKATSSRFTSLTTNTTQTSIITTASTSTTTTTSFLALSSSTYTPSSKYSSVIVEKPLNIGKKLDTTKSTTILKKNVEKTMTDALHNLPTINVMGKDFLKIETTAAASPTSSTSSISSHISTNSSRSIPDMSKLDISSPSSSSSSFKDVKATGNALAHLSNIPNKPTSPDIYEFKDTEPFEFEIRKPPLSAASSSSSNITAHSSTNMQCAGNLAYGVPLSARRQSYKPGTSAAAAASDSSNLSFVPSLLGRKKRGSPLKDIAGSEKLKQSKLEEKPTVITVTSTNNNLVADAKLSHHVMPVVTPPTPTKSTSISLLNKLALTTSGFAALPASVPTTQQAASTTAANNVPPVTSIMPKSSSITVVSCSPAPTSSLTATTTPNKANAFDVLRKSPSFNLINALNEELAQTVQETTRALTDVVMPATPSTPPVIDMAATVKGAIEDMLPLPTTTTTITSSTASDSKVPSTIVATEVSSTHLQSPVKAASTPKIVSSVSVVSTPSTAPTITTPTTTKSTVGSPFMETKKNLSNVFEMCSYDVASTSIETRDTKFGLEKAKFLLSATVGGGFDFEPTLKTEHKPVSIADKVLKAISQKKEEENKIKEQKPEVGITSTDVTPSTSAASWPLIAAGPSKPLNSAESPLRETTAAMPAVTISSNVDGAAKLTPISFVATLASTSTKALNSPETTKLSLLEANAGKNANLNETIQKLECAIQRKTCASLKTAATAALPFSTTVSTILTSSPATNFSEESIDSTDSERRLVIEDVADELPKSPVIMIKQQQQQQVTENKRENTTPLPLGDVVATHMPVSSSSPTISHMSSMSCESGVSLASFEPKLNVPNTVCITVPEIPVSVVMATASATKLKPTPLLMTTRSEMLLTTTTTTTTTMTPTTTSNNATTNSANILTPSTSGFFLNSRTELRPEDGVKPISDMLLHAVSAQADVERAKEEIEQAAHIAHAGNAGGVSGTEVQHDSINLLCEETIPGSPAPAVSKEEPSLVAAQQQLPQTDGKLHSVALQPIGNLEVNKNAANGNIIQNKSQQQQIQQQPQQQQQQQHSSPNESCSQDESGEESKKTQSEQEFGPRKRRRTRKTSERDGQQQQQQEGSVKRRRNTTHKKNNQGSDSDENSDSLAIRSAISTRQQQMQQQQQFQTLQQPQLQEQGMSTGLRPCPYNFLVQLDPTLSSDQCIAILLKQIQELRKTYNNIKGDLAAIDRRRKKIRRRNREKKQNQNQQPTQLMKVSATS